MFVSLIIPTYNASSYLEKLLKIMKQQSISYELIIIDSSSTDSTKNILEPLADTFITIPKKEFDHGGTRTIAAKAAKGEILLFLTQDALPASSTSFETLLDAFKDPQVAAAYGRQLPYKTTNIFGKHLRYFNYPKSSCVRSLEDKKTYGMKTAFLSDSFAAYRKSAMHEVDYFQDGLIFGEDNHIGAKLLLKGYSIAYVAQAEVYHSHSYHPIQEFQRYFDMGVFHTQEHWILDTFGKAEGEGGRYVKSEFKYLLQHKAYSKIPLFFLRNGLKYIGYKLGKNYIKFPKRIVPILSMQSSWWTKQA